jgi:carboxylesterase type B
MSFLPIPFSYPENTKVDASKPGAACPQQKVPVPGFPLFSNVTDPSENCLTLRIARAVNTAEGFLKLPVMAYIYGGGDTSGQAYDQAYTPVELVRGAAEKKIPIIYVAMKCATQLIFLTHSLIAYSYRVGFFGFAASPGLREEGSLNAGRLDQRLALEWIQKNFHLFGGDPENVTIFGESAGANSVGQQIVAYGGEQRAPFQRAIMQSGAATSEGGATLNTTQEHTQTLTALVNCTAANST